MKANHRWLLLVVIIVLSALALPGCATVKKTQFQVKNRCLTRSTPSNGDAFELDCAPRNEVCGAYFIGEALDNMTRSQCLDHCKDVEREQKSLHLVDGCWWLIQQTRDQCDMYCLGKPEGE